jgi:hypothetical protein
LEGEVREVVDPWPYDTLTLDDDVAAKLKALTRRAGRPFRDVVNDTLRRGLVQPTGARSHRAVRAMSWRPTRPRQPTRRCGCNQTAGVASSRTRMDALTRREMLERSAAVAGGLAPIVSKARTTAMQRQATREIKFAAIGLNHGHI